jgi:excisionase family DNA binding protein
MSKENHEREPFPVLTVKVSEAIRILGISRSSFYELLNNGTLRGRRFGRDLLIEMSELERWIAALPYRESHAGRRTGAPQESAAAEI